MVTRHVYNVFVRHSIGLHFLAFCVAIKYHNQFPADLCVSTLLVLLFLLLVLLYFKCQLLHVVAWTTHSVLLPEPCTPFLGRERELDDLMKLVDIHSGNEERIVSIVGPTGVGKSCLAVQVGHSVIDSGATVSYVDTSLFSLDTLADQVLRSTRSIRERGNNSTQRLLQWLRQEGMIGMAECITMPYNEVSSEEHL